MNLFICSAVLWSCAFAFPRDFLLSTDWLRNDIYAISLDGGENVPLNLSTKFPTGVAYNPLTREVFWSEYMMQSDAKPSSVNKVKINENGKVSGRVSMPLMKDDTVTSSSKYIAVDYKTGNVWMAQYPAPAIKVADKGLMKIASIVKDDLQKPSGIAVHPELRMIYFCDHGRLTVESAHMDGRMRKVLVQVETSPFGLTIDIEGGKLYWLDDDMTSLLTIDLNGNRLRSLMKGQHAFQSIALDSDYVYFTDAPENNVYRVSRYGAANAMSMGNFMNGHMHGLTIHKHVAGLRADPVCANKNGGCPKEAICLPTRSGYACAEKDMTVRVPDPPMFVSSLYRSSTRVTLSWNPPMSVVSAYLVRYSVAGSSDMKEVKVTGNMNTVELRSLLPGSRYDVMIFSMNMNYVMSATSARITFTTESQRSQASIVSGPDDVTTKANMDVMMHCEIDDFTSDLHLVWAMEDPYMEIYSFKDGRGALADPNSEKYEVTMMGYKFFLKIRNVQWSDAMMYTCEVRGGAGSRMSSNLVVFHDVEFVTPALQEGTSGKFVAAGYYGSPRKDKLRTSQVPFLKCFMDEGGFLMGSTTITPGMTGDVNYIIRWEMMMSVYADYNNRNFTCRIGTEKPDFYVDFTTQLKVLFSVRNVDLMPMKSSYSYGDKIMCMANGNPAPEYVWSNSRYGMTMRSQTLELTGENAKDSWMCMAYNVINGVTESAQAKREIRMKDQYCIHGKACRALCGNGVGTVTTDMNDYCCVTFAPCANCSGYGSDGCHKTMCSAPSYYRDGICEC